MSNKTKVFLGLGISLVFVLGIVGGAFFVARNQSQDLRSKAAPEGTASCPPINDWVDPARDPFPLNLTDKVNPETRFRWNLPGGYENWQYTVKLYDCSDGTDNCLVAISNQGASTSRSQGEFQHPSGRPFPGLECYKQYWWRVVLVSPGGCPVQNAYTLWTFKTGCHNDYVNYAPVTQGPMSAYSSRAGMKGVVIYHRFPDEASCKKVENSRQKCASYPSNRERIADPDCLEYWVLYPSLVCPRGSKWDVDGNALGRAQCENLNMTQYRQTSGSYLMLSAAPYCSAVQFDPDDGVFQAGSTHINCEGCVLPPPIDCVDLKPEDPNLDLNNLEVDKAYRFKVTLAGPARGFVTPAYYDNDCKTEENTTPLKANGPGTYISSWKPSRPGDFTLFVEVGGENDNVCRTDCLGSKQACPTTTTCRLKGRVKGQPPLAACQKVEADKDLSTIKIGDVITFTGWGSVAVTPVSDSIDKINFRVLRNGTEVANQTVDAVLASPPGGPIVGANWYKATYQYTVTEEGDYTVIIKVHQKNADRWLE